MIRIIHYVPNLNCNSGIATMIMNYYRHIDRSKIQFDFIHFRKNNKNSNFEEEIKKMGGRINYVTPPTKYFSFKKQMSQYFSKLDRKNKYIFHNHQIAFTILLFPIVSKVINTTFITHNHMTKYSDKLISSIRNFILCLPVKHMNIKLFACSKDAGELIFGKQRKDFFVMNNGIEVESFLFNHAKREKLRKELGIRDNFVVGHIGRFEKSKNHQFMIRVFKDVKKQHKNAKLLLIGSGSQKVKILAKSKKMGLQNSIIFLGDKKNIADYLCAMDVFIFPSKFEGLGIASIEAQASGVPVVMSDRVPKIAQVHNCKVLGLTRKNGIWVDGILNARTSNDRKKGNRIINKTVFNIKNNIREVENMYCDIASRKS